jgi:hypothetical protein
MVLHWGRQRVGGGEELWVSDGHNSGDDASGGGGEAEGQRDVEASGRGKKRDGRLCVHHGKDSGGTKNESWSMGRLRKPELNKRECRGRTAEAWMGEVRCAAKEGWPR